MLQPRNKYLTAVKGEHKALPIKAYVERLIQGGLIVCGIGENGSDALYDLLSNLYIIPITSGLLVKVMAFLKFIFVNGLPFNKAKTVFSSEKLSVILYIFRR